MRFFVQTFIKLAMAFGVLTAITACATMEGIGKDIQSLGSAIAGSAKKGDASSSTEGQKAPASDAVVTPIK